MSERLLHVAALPFPTYQGTQALLRSMLECEADAGRDSHLLTYGVAGYPLTPRFVLHRSGSCAAAMSLRSGPSPAKILADGRLTLRLRRLARSLRFRAVVAHHVEAAGAALLAGVSPVLFFAHTDLSAELPWYGPAWAAPLLARAGRRVDRALVLRCAATAAVSPALAHRLQTARDADRSGPIRYVPPPLCVPVSLPGRAVARRDLGLPPRAPVLLYAGNLDRYQGVDRLLPLLKRVRDRYPEARLLLATASDARAFFDQAAIAGLSHWVTVRPLGPEATRAAFHAAADLAVVPRRAPGGVPIKLLDALARGLPVVAGPTACAGLPLREVCGLASSDAPAALAAQACALLADPQRRARLSDAGRRYMRRMHGPRAYLSVLDGLLDGLSPRPRET